MKDKHKAPLDYVQNGLQGLLGSLTMLIYGAFALLVLMVAFGFVYAMLIG
ncbi:hypothetical protein [Rhodovibrio sodomensis]|nr:hypothetical protein [Rhodovibrio sodomensis]